MSGPPATWLVGLVVVAVTAACSGESSIDPRATADDATAPATAAGSDRSASPGGGTASLPACVPAATPVPVPAAFPPEFPFPAGSVVTSAGETYAGGMYAEGYAPLRLDDARRFFVEAVPAAGFQLVVWEQEMIEADGHFRGHGVTGTWIVVIAQDCPDAVYFSIGTYPEE